MDSEAAAQEVCDRIHTLLLGDNELYAQSVESGHTLRWDVPHQDDDGWYVTVDDRCIGALTETELAQVQV